MMASMSTSVVAARGATVSVASGISALRPLPRAGRFGGCMVSITLVDRSRRSRVLVLCARGGCGSRRRHGAALEHFARERDIRFGPFRLYVVKHHRHPMARRLAEAHVARNDGAEHFLPEELAHVGRDLSPEIRALVEHR